MADYEGVSVSDHICATEACALRAVSRGFCSIHYSAWHRSEAAQAQRPRCSIEDCDKPTEAHKLCDMHYRRAKRSGQIPKPPATVEGRFLSHTECADNGCLIWTGSIAPNGYGQSVVNGKYAGAHCASYALFVGPIPDGLELDHACHTNDLTCPGGLACLHRRCVNPAHLEPVTPLENKQRAWRRRRGILTPAA